MLRSLGPAALLVACVACVACGPSKGQPPAPATAANVNDDATRDPSTHCRPLGGDATATVRLLSHGSHALAKTDLTLDLGDARLTGEDFVLDDDGNTPRPLPVDQAVDAAALAELRATLAAICVARVALAEDSFAAPGGSSALEVTETDGGQFWITLGTAQLPAPAVVARVSVDQWKQLMALWPASEGK